MSTPAYPHAAEAFAKHVQLGKDIDRLIEQRFFLSKEFNKKKCDYMCTRCRNAKGPFPELCVNHSRAKYHPRCEADAQLQSALIFLKRNMISTRHPFPSSFRCYLEEVLLVSVPRDMKGCLRVYYGERTKPTQEECAHLVLSSEGIMTPNDRAIVIAYTKELITWMQQAVQLTKAHPQTRPHWIKPMEKELCRTIKVTQEYIKD